MRALKQSLNRLKAGVPRSTWLNTRTFSKHNINEEDPARYCPGGYHPVRIGDEFNSGTYKVISKLGYGIYSTVWLARNLRTNQHFALKFLTADSFDGRKDSFELEILKHVTIQAGESPKVAGSQHVLGLLDEFRHNGPNGQHVCLVFKAMGPDLSKYRRMFPRLAIPIPIAKRISKQLLIALAFLHDDCRVIHTDIKPQNILLETNEINEMFAHAPSDVFTPQFPSLEPPDDYYMRSEQISSAEEDLTTSNDISFRLSDFGTSSRFDKHLTEWIQPSMLRAPEVILGAQWDFKVDIWNLGLVIWELVQGQLMFDGQATATAEYSSEAHLSQMMAILGPLPKSLLERSKFSRKYLDAKGQVIDGLCFSSRSLERLNRHSNSPGGGEEFIDFISSMLRLEPRERPTARTLLSADWLKVI